MLGKGSFREIGGPVARAQALPASLTCSTDPCRVLPIRQNAQRRHWANLAFALLFLCAALYRRSAASDGAAEGVWMIEDDVAIVVTPCGQGALCGRIAWLRTPRDDAGHAKQDDRNPDGALRRRPLCGLTVLSGLLPVPDEPGKWNGGSFYDPRDGQSYGLTATLTSADVLVVRVYIGMPFLGSNQTMLRVRRATGEGWC